MYTRPSIVDMIEAVMNSLNRDLSCELHSSHAETSLVMNQTLLQCVIQRLQGESQALVSDHNEMTALYRRLAEMLASSQGPPAERVRERGSRLGGRSDLSLASSQPELYSAHFLLSEELISTLDDLDELIRAGDTQGSAALLVLRQQIGVRAGRDFHTLMVNPGSLAGRA